MPNPSLSSSAASPGAPSAAPSSASQGASTSVLSDAASAVPQINELSLLRRDESLDPYYGSKLYSTLEAVAEDLKNSWIETAKTANIEPP